MPTQSPPDRWADLSSRFCNLFAVWILCASGAGLTRPSTFTWLGRSSIKQLLILLSFLVGMTTKPDEFVACLRKPRPIGVNLVSCFALCPALALALAKGFCLSNELLAGMVLLGSVNGGSTSNLCALIADADVPLSVLMTTSSTLLAVFATPLLCKVVLGTVVPVDAMGILNSAVQIVLLPVFLGVAMGSLAPRTCVALKPVIPVAGVAMGVVAIGAIVAGSAGPIWEGGALMHLAVILFHLLAGLFGYTISALTGGAGEKERRTVALEVAMKNCAFATVLATAHFEEIAIRAPAAASCIWCPTLASVVAVIWRGRPTSSDGTWVGAYKT